MSSTASPRLTLSRNICLFLLATTAASTPFARHHKRAGTFAITGVDSGGPVHPRLEIRTLQQNADQWNLYLLAMQYFKNTDQTQQESYYQIAGIHGVPNIPWDGVQANPASGGAVGYCTHSSILFPTWHRAYLALFEQNFFYAVENVVMSFTDQNLRWRYYVAALSLRIPYWDWAAPPPSGQSILPDSITAPTVVVNTPNGTQTIANPLYNYNFHPLNGNDMIYDPWASWPTTFRYPNSTNVSQVSTTFSNDASAAAALDNNADSIRDNVYNMFSLCDNYTSFSNDATTSSSPACHTSLEGIHDAIHNLVGGNNYGHMTWLWWAAFDPVFWLHHANVDRLFAMWQAIYPTSYFNDSVAAKGATFTIATGDIQTAMSPLTPFHSDSSGTLFTSNAVRNHTRFMYTYPEFMSTDGSSSAMMGVVNQLYGRSTAASSDISSRFKRSPSDILARSDDATETASGGHYEYITNIVTERFGLNGTYNILVFLGPPASSDPATWLTDASLVGTQGVFAVSLPEGTPLPTHKITGAVPLTTKLLGKVATGELPSMRARDVKPYLKRKLLWKVVLASNGTSIDPALVPGLQVSVVHAQAQKAKDSHSFPVWSNWSAV